MNTSAEPTLDRLELLHTLVRIVEAGSLSAAARQLGTTQPTVSRRLRQLEAYWGVQLLQRSTHAMKLTEDGERAYQQAKALLERWHGMDADLRGREAAALRGHLRVLAPSIFGQEQLVPALVGFLQAHPQVSVDWLLNDRLPDFIAEGIDCAIRVGRVDEPNLVAIALAEVPRIAIGAPTLWPSDEAPQTPAELAKLPWLALRTFYADEVVLHHRHTGEAARFAISPRLGTDNLQALRNAALAGVGAGVASAWAVADDIAHGRLVHLAPDWQAPPLPIYLLYPRSSWRSPRLKAFIEAMRAGFPQVHGVQPLAARGAERPGDS